jgi:hypothetical protein
MPKILLALLALAVLATEASADMLRCKIEGFEGYVFVTTLPDTNDNDSQYARIGISPGIDNRALVFADLMGPQVFVELNGTGTPVALLTVQKDGRAIKSNNRFPRQSLFAIPK